MNNALAILLRRARGGDGRLGSILSQSVFASDAVGDLLSAESDHPRQHCFKRIGLAPHWV
jgi:hypothetical protein